MALHQRPPPESLRNHLHAEVGLCVRSTGRIPCVSGVLVRFVFHAELRGMQRLLQLADDGPTHGTLFHRSRGCAPPPDRTQSHPNLDRCDASWRTTLREIRNLVPCKPPSHPVRRDG
eukprot:scaffold1486_cov314-Pavlova_lutheri.AAC.1